MSEASPLALERNLALMAGAGAGKTYSLVTMVLHLLAGAREAAGPLRPARLCMLTFTDKAAAEMRARTRSRLDALAQGEASEPELRASLERLGRPFPALDAWRELREELSAATVGTFHSLCGQLLRRAPPGLGIDPAFEVLDELEASGLVQDVCERVVLDALEAGDALTRELCQELTFSGSGFSDGLVASLRHVYGKLREEGLRAASAPVAQPEQALAELEAILREARELCTSARGLDARREWSRLLGACERALEGMTPENLFAADRLPALMAAFRADGRNFARLSKGAAGPIRVLYWRVFGKSDGSVTRLEDAFAAWRTAPFEATFRDLLGRVEERHEVEFSRRNVFDFTALLVKARDLLRDHPVFRDQMQQRMGALLVDEFQDTNRLQLELVLLLAERREGGPRHVPPDAELLAELPLEPAFLCAVGDRKQSIYEFRGADVSVFTLLEKKIVSEGGAKDFLRHNRRSVPALLAFFNRTFTGVLVASQPPRPYEVAYRPEEDDLSPVRPALAEGPSVERLRLGEAASTAEARENDAEAVARRLRVLLAPGAEPWVTHEDGQRLRPARGGDVAILLRTFTHLEVYRQALIRHGVPHRVLRGRGFYGAQEVLDLASLLALLSDSDDSLALAAVLRSPLVGLADASLFRLAGEEGLTLTGVKKHLSTEEFPPRERLRLERFLTALPSLRRERDRLGVRALLQVALEVTGYREAMAGTPYAEQASANIDKLLVLAGRRDERGTGGCVAFARELRLLADSDPTEAQADLLDADDPRAVQILTIHRAKGLEWPVVVVPALGGRRRSTSGRAHFERTHGLSLRPWLPDTLEDFSSPRFEQVKEELRARELAEYRRLLYVALTRARDRLILSGSEERGAGESWWLMITGRLEADSELRTLVRDVDVDAFPPPADPLPPSAEQLEKAEARVEAAVRRVREGGPAPEPELAIASAAALQDFMVCPRRYRYMHQIGMRGLRPWELHARTVPPWVELESWLETRGPAQLVPLLLHEVDLGLAGAPASERRAHAETLLRRQGRLPDDEGMEEVLGMVERFLGTAFARRLAASPSSRLHRALPFMLELSPGSAQRGRAVVDGELDLLWETPEGEAWVVACRPGRRHPLGAAACAHDLVVHGLAARRLVREGVTVRVGVAFLGEPSPEPEFLTLPGGLEEALPRLEEALRALARGDLRREWPGRERATCLALHCGFSEHCHPSPGAC